MSINTLIRTTLLCLFACTALNAQSNWRPAYIIVNGQKITGQVDDREWAYHIGSIDFRTDKNSPVTTYRPEDSVVVDVGGRRFASTTISYITNSRDLDKLTRDTVLTRTTETVFARQYYDGELALLQFIDQADKRHFYLRARGKEPVYLEYELRLRDTYNKKVVRYLENYKYQLIQVLNGCPELSAQISETAYKLKDISLLVRQWYKCRSFKPEYVAKVNGGHLAFGLSAAYVQSTFTNPSTGEGTVSNEPHRGISPSIGVRYAFPGVRERYVVKGEAGYQRIDGMVRSISNQGNVNTNIISRELDASYLLASLMAEFHVLSGKPSIYVEAGIVSAFVLSSDLVGRQIAVAPDGSQSVITSDLNVAINEANEIGPALGLGACVGKFQIGLRGSRLTKLKGNGSLGINRVGLFTTYWF